MTLFLLILDVVLLAMAGYYLYWQARIDLYGRYSSFQVIFATILGFWFISTGITDFLYIIFMAAFLTITVMTGTTGITPTKVISVGIFQRVTPLAKLHGVTLMPLDLPNGQSWVMAVFAIGDRRFVRLTFKTSLPELMATLRPRVPNDVEIVVQRVN